MSAYDWFVIAALVALIAVLVVAIVVGVALFHIISGAFALLSILTVGGIPA